MVKSKSYISPYLAGFCLGLVLLASFVIMGRGLGASGAMMRGVVAVEKLVAPEHTQNNSYLQRYGGGKDGSPLASYLVFLVGGLFCGAAVSGFMGGRSKVETLKGPRITEKNRLWLALLGGSLFGIGTRLAMGCTSGQALSGGAVLSLGSWVTMMCIFAGAYMFAWFLRKQWI